MKNPGQINLVRVRIWGSDVGVVAADSVLGCYVFEYMPAWRNRGIELAPIQMKTKSPASIFAFPTLGESFKKLPGMLSDALPDDFGNSLIDAWMAQKGYDKAAITPLDRLTYMGKRGLGALEFHPDARGSVESSHAIEMKTLVEAARRSVFGDLSGDAEAQAALANIIRVGTSAGGARAKAVIAWNPETHEIRSGQFDVAPGFEHWLLKFDGMGHDSELGTSQDYGRIEYVYHLLAKNAGIVMSPCRLIEENGRAHFMTKRFDRDGNTKHHIQSLCAIAHLDYKQRATHAYEQLFITIKSMELGDEALSQAFLRMAFNVMSRNCDDHTKNFGFRLKQGGSWELAPAFDVTHAHNPVGKWTNQHLMSVNGRFDEISRRDLLQVAERFNVPAPVDRLADVRRALEKWNDYARKENVGADTIEKVRNDFRLV